MIRHFSRTLAREGRRWQARAAFSSNFTSPVRTVECPSVHSKEFTALIKIHYAKQEPLLVKNCLKCSALKDWTNIDYLVQRIGGDQIVDVELGEYRSGEKLQLPLESFMHYLDLTREHEGPLPRENLLYLAQSDLPSVLMDDVEIPDLCHNPDCGVGEGKLYQVMFWMGPHSTTSPLHSDPLDNFLMQMVGKKEILVVSKETPENYLYCGEEFGQQTNTSAVDVKNPDLKKYPLFAKVPMLRAILEPGDVLYIPSKAFHYAHALDLSISVNAWWR